MARHNGIRTKRYKLIHFYQFDEWELYDLEKDPDELQNLYGKPQYADLIGELKRDLVDLREHYGDNTDTSVKPAAWRKQYRQ